MVLLLVACARPTTPVGASLADGQVLVGDVATPVLALEGALGAVDIPLDDVGMIAPVEGLTLGDSHGNVVVWLRNGSELRGVWQQPELALSVRLGGRDVPIDVPTERLLALQLRGEEQWPSDGLYRVRTTHGDDFLVDPATTRLHVKNDLGDFQILLAECATVGPLAAPDGDWRLALHTGTVLVGRMSDANVRFSLPLGPRHVDVPLTSIVSLQRSVWAPGGDKDEGEQAAPTVQIAPSRPVRGGLGRADGWFENERLYDAKH
jgi:hypothetical protein